MPDPLVTALIGKFREAALEAALTRLSDQWQKVTSERAQAEVRRLLEDIYVALEHGDPAEKEGQVQALVAAAPETALEYVRSSMDALGEEARPYLSALTAMYLITCRPRDRFFRRATQMLRDASDEEIRSLRELARSVRQLGGHDLDRAESITLEASHDPEHLRACLTVPYTPGVAHYQKSNHDGRLPSGWPHAFGVLSRAGFMEDTTGAGYLEVPGGPYVITASPPHVVDFQRLVDLLTFRFRAS